MSDTGFEFPFQRVLDVREQQELSLQMQVAGAKKDLREARAELERWEEARGKALDGISRARCRGELGEAATHSRYLEHIRRRLTDCRNTVGELEQEKHHLQQELTRVMQSRKMLETHRERLEREYLARREKAEERVVELHSTHTFIQAERAQ